MRKSPSCSPPKERSRSRKRRRSTSSRSRRSRRSRHRSSRRHSSRSPRRGRSRRRQRRRSLSFDSNRTPTQIAGLQDMITQAVQAAVAATAVSMTNLPTNQNVNAIAPASRQAKQLLRGTIPPIKFVRAPLLLVNLFASSATILNIRNAFRTPKS